MADQKNPENGRGNNPNRSNQLNPEPGWQREKHAFMGEPLQPVQQIPATSQVNVPVRTNRSPQGEK
jgi:hypothetical protein